jgi:hypothetical protein
MFLWENEEQINSTAAITNFGKNGEHRHFQRFTRRQVLQTNVLT